MGRQKLLNLLNYCLSNIDYCMCTEDFESLENVEIFYFVLGNELLGSEL